jgi:hypothetical protein
MSERVDPETVPPPVRGPLQGLEDLSDFVAEHPVRTGAFVRGLTIGVLVGAAIAGSAIWRRWLRGGARRNRADGG